MPEYSKIENLLRNSKKNNLTNQEIDELKIRRKELDIYIRKQKDDFLNTSQNSTYQLIAHEFTNITTDMLTNLNHDIVKKYGNDRLDIIRGLKSPSTSKKGIPIPFSVNKNEPFIFVDGECYLEWFKGKTKEATGKALWFKLHFGKDKSNNRVIVERIDN